MFAADAICPKKSTSWIDGSTALFMPSAAVSQKAPHVGADYAACPSRVKLPTAPM